MTFTEFQENARKTAIYPNVGSNLTYPLFGLFNEVGEVAGKAKKNMRDCGGVRTDEFLKAMSKELGDVLWYLAAVCDELGISLEDVATGNNTKLADRQKRGTLQGDGDDR